MLETVVSNLNFQCFINAFLLFIFRVNSGLVKTLILQFCRLLKNSPSLRRLTKWFTYWLVITSSTQPALFITTKGNYEQLSDPKM